MKKTFWILKIDFDKNFQKYLNSKIYFVCVFFVLKNSKKYLGDTD